MGVEQAHADWEWTRWGMSPVQALSASQGKAVAATAAERQRRAYRKGFVPIRVPELVADHLVSGSLFQAYLLFDIDTAKLVCVDLLPKPGNGHPADLRAALIGGLGNPVQEKHQQLPGVEWTTTTWMTATDKIDLQQGGLGTKLQYCQREPGQPDQGQVAAR